MGRAGDGGVHYAVAAAAAAPPPAPAARFRECCEKVREEVVSVLPV